MLFVACNFRSFLDHRSLGGVGNEVGSPQPWFNKLNIFGEVIEPILFCLCFLFEVTSETIHAMIEKVRIPADTPTDELIERVSHTVDNQGVAVIMGRHSIQQAMRVRSQVRNLLIPTIPLRAVRVGAEKVLGRDRTPDLLQRRPISVRRKNTHRYFTPLVELMFAEMDQLNEELLATDVLNSRFNGVRHQISEVVLNRVAPYEEFEKHQDSRTITGLAYIMQTSPTLWHIHELGPRVGMGPLDFYTSAGDLVILAASRDNGSASAERHAGFSNFDPNGSVVHSGENLTNRNRFTAALFSRPPSERV